MSQNLNSWIQGLSDLQPLPLHLMLPVLYSGYCPDLHSVQTHHLRQAPHFPLTALRAAARQLHFQLEAHGSSPLPPDLPQTASHLIVFY